MEFLLKNIEKIIPIINLIIICSFLLFDYKKKIIHKELNKISILNNNNFDYLIIFFLLCVAYNYFNNYFSPYFITDIHENAWINTTLAFSKDINPLILNNSSEFANLYSSVWPLLVSKFAFLTELKISSIKNLMHIINLFVFIFFCFLIIQFIEKKNKINLILILASCYLIFTQRTNLGSSPHTIGMAMYTIAIFISYFKKGNFYLSVSLILITFASLFKQYFFLGIFLVAIPHLEKLEIKKIMIFLIWVIITSIIYFVLNYNYEMYLDIHYNFYLNYSKFVKLEIYRIFYEVGYLLKYFPFLIIIFIYSIIDYDFKVAHKRKFFITSLLVVIFIISKMWTNKGNFGIYSLHLILPLMLVYIVEFINNNQDKKKFFSLINIFIVISILINFNNEFGYIDNKKIKKNEKLFFKINDIVKKKDKDNLFLDMGLTLINDDNNIIYYNAGHKTLIEGYINARKNGFLKRSSFEEFFLKQVNKNESYKNEKFKKEIFTNEMYELKNYDLAICSICPKSLESFEIYKVGKLYIKSVKPIDVKILSKGGKF